MAITWSSRLAVGVESIDSQHRELFDRVNRLLSALEARQGAAEVARLLAFLCEYTVTHFSAEERLMQREGYPALDDHRQLHAGFVGELRRTEEDLKRSGPTSAMAVRLNHQACRWLLDHIAVTDRALAAWLAARPGAAASRTA